MAIPAAIEENIYSLAEENKLESLAHPKMIRKEPKIEAPKSKDVPQPKRPTVPRATEIIKLAPREDRNYVKGNIKENITQQAKAPNVKQVKTLQEDNPNYGKIPK